MKRQAVAVIVFMLLSGLAMPFSEIDAWTYQINGSLNSDDWVHAVVVDAAGDVYAAGVLNVTYVTPFDWRWVVVKLSGGTGKEIWRKEFPGGYPTSATSLALDATGSLIVGGVVNGHFAVKKLSQQDGSTFWEKELPGAYPNFDLVNALKIGPEGEIYAAGLVSHLLGKQDFTVVKLAASDGAILWTYFLDGPSHIDDGAGALALRPTGEVIVTGSLGHLEFTFHQDLVTVALSPSDGHEIWRYGFHPASGRSVDTDAAGQVFVVGGGETGLPASMLDGSTGAEQWHTGVAGNDFGAAVGVVDAAGDLLLAGWDYSQSEFLSEFVVAKLAGSSGVVDWVNTPFGRSEEALYASAICLDGAGNPVAVGAAPGAASGRDLAVVKLSSTSGATLWQTLKTSSGEAEDSGNACAVDGAGDVIAAGYMTGATSGKDFVVLKLSGSSGHDFQNDALSLLGNLIDEVSSLGLSPGITTSLQANLLAASRLLEDFNGSNDRAAGRPIMAFIQQVEALRDVHISSADADRLIADAQAILDVLSGSAHRASGPKGSRNRPNGLEEPGHASPTSSPRSPRPLIRD